ncbi:hypothetical protein BCH_01759 [Brucella sp. 191011898]|nr:hypothetical protein BCH_01759 [Brucella sp. 191011898]
MDQELLRKVTWCVRARSKSRHAGLQMALLIQAPGPGIEYRVLSISAGLEMKSRHSQMSSAVATERGRRHKKFATKGVSPPMYGLENAPNSGAVFRNDRANMHMSL